MHRIDERMTPAMNICQPVDLAFSNGLGILLRERRRLNRRDDLIGRDLIPVTSESAGLRVGGRTGHRMDSIKNGAR